MRDRVAAAERKRSLVTPEGVALELRIPTLAERFGAVTYDVALMVAIVFVSILLRIALYIFLLSGFADRQILLAAGIVFDFLLINGYFIYFESKPGGATPGKRRLGLRVINRAGGPLRTESIIARNLTRNFEILFPLIAFSTYASDRSESHVGAMAFLFGLVVLAATPPFFTRDRLRVGDLLGGTLVVAAPKAKLLSELGGARRSAPAHVFTRDNLQIYGIYELQVLEDLLRTAPDVNKQQLATVAQKIRAKIGYAGEVGNAKRFLRDFYAAQRAHLEHELVLGKRKERKDS